MNETRIVFAGTPRFALASLTALVAADMRPVAVMTQPDRPAGRGKKLTASPVKKFALDESIPVLQPATLRDADAVAAIGALQPDLIIVAAYGLILPQSVLDIPHLGCLNVHASLLPRWRGAAPIQAAILAGDGETGISLMQMTAGLDCGPVFKTATIEIGADETAGELHDRLAELGGDTLVRYLPDIIGGALAAIPQDESLVTVAGKIGTADAKLDWARSADELLRVVRAFNPVPGAHFQFGDERIKCWRASVGDSVKAEPGTVVAAGRDGVVVACADGTLKLSSLQRPGRNVVTAGEFAAQFDLDDGQFG